MSTRNSSETGLHVSQNDLEALLAHVVRDEADARTGIFGPESICWRINRESALFLGAGRAALLQLAHPWVAVALEQHSSLLSNPIARFHNTFRIVFTMVFGSKAQAFAAARSLHRMHEQIRGELPAAVGGYSRGSGYQANFIPALRWVFATLVESAVMSYQWVLPALTDAEREAYYAESRTLAALFGIPEDALPTNWATFSAYIAEMCASDALGVDERSRGMAQNLLTGAGSWIHPPRWYRALTAAWIPERFRRDFALELSAQDERDLETTRRRLASLYSRLPGFAHFVGPYQEALARIAQRPAGPMTRAVNRFWIGQALLPFRERG